jgi:flagellar hook-basal body complex protein FliE
MSAITQVQSELLGRMDNIKQAVQAPIADAAPFQGVNDGDGFRAAFSDVFNAIDAQQHSAAAKVHAVEIGASEDLVGAMVESQKASISFSALMQVRNKVASAFDEVMRLSV